MLNNVFASLSFLGDFHPIAVHFPIALIPAVLLIRLYARRFRDDAAAFDNVVRFLLYFTLLCAVAAVALGVTNAVSSGYSAEAVGKHFSFAVATTALLALACLLQQRDAFVRALGSGVANTLRLLGRAIGLLLWATFKILKWPLIILLFPLYLLWRLLRRLPRALPGELRQRCRAALGKGARNALTRCREAINRRLTLPGLRTATLVMAFALVLLTGLEGANLSRGEGHLTRNMPPALAALFGSSGHLEANRQLDQDYYEQIVLPVLRRSCIKCHGEDRQQAGLRLDSYAAAVESGVIRWQDPYGSEMIRRILLPRDTATAMPPRGEARELRSADIAVLVNWIQGHSLETLARQDAGPSGELRALADSLKLVEDDELGALNTLEGIRVMRLVEDYDLLVVNLRFLPQALLDEALAMLRPFADHIVDLDLAGAALTPEQWQQVAAMKNLQKLNLSRSEISDRELRELASLRRLEWLNVYDTTVSLSAEELQALWPSLKRIHLPQAPESASADIRRPNAPRPAEYN